MEKERPDALEMAEKKDEKGEEEKSNQVIALFFLFFFLSLNLPFWPIMPIFNSKL